MHLQSGHDRYLLISTPRLLPRSCRLEKLTIVVIYQSQRRQILEDGAMKNLRHIRGAAIGASAILVHSVLLEGELALFWRLASGFIRFTTIFACN